MGNGAGLGEPPWVYSPSESVRWASSTSAGGKKGRGKRAKRPRTVRNPRLRMTLGVEKTELAPSGSLKSAFARLLGRVKVREDMDMVEATRVVLKALSKAGMGHRVQVEADGFRLLSFEDTAKGLSAGMKRLEGDRKLWENSDAVRIRGPGGRKGSANVDIRIKRVHKRRESPIDIRFKGDVDGEKLATFTDHVKKKLGIKGVK